MRCEHCGWSLDGSDYNHSEECHRLTCRPGPQPYNQLALGLCWWMRWAHGRDRYDLRAQLELMRSLVISGR
jgi:hypothetical protein